MMATAGKPEGEKSDLSASGVVLRSLNFIRTEWGKAS
jgi:hypothetical protein